MKRVLIVDDDRRSRRVLQILVERLGLESQAVDNAEDALATLREESAALVLTDLKMPGATGIDLLGQIRAEHPKLPVVLITAYGTIETAIEAMRKGAGLKGITSDTFDFRHTLSYPMKLVPVIGFKDGQPYVITDKIPEQVPYLKPKS